MGEMNLAEISSNELLLIIASITVLGVIGGFIGEKLKIPDVVIYLLFGVAFGPTFLNAVNIDAFPVANELILTFGSAFILYEGGREVKLKILNEVKITVLLLSSLGVFITAGIVALPSYFILDLPIGTSMLLGSIIASTDPASLIPVFKQFPVKNRLKQTVISESAFNDAFGAILFSTVFVGLTSSGKMYLSQIIFKLFYMIVVGIVVGTIIALIATALTSEKKYGVFAKYEALISIIIVIFAYEISEKLGGSGYMSVFISGLVAGNKKVFGFWIADEIYMEGIHFRENISKIARMCIFIILGTHLDLNSLIKYGNKVFLVILVFTFVTRPIVVMICTAFDRKVEWSWNEKIFMMWVRETGVIPAALSGIVVSSKIPGYNVISSTVFMAIIFTLLVQASTTGIVAKKLNVLEKDIVKEG
ncbi:MULTISPECIES: cation:proton antiporter [unclassified Romboutsia]|uniref:cation:proton antiporter n=1 Tax=unclassified Romboutsia TaxID=2626894 RepID=UPI000822170D|nr:MULTISPECIES: cation:proton antiporter [unclassified Romboutsia]SCI01144.1 potassium/proton antiporter [uncultured Clostridium sp.]